MGGLFGNTTKSVPQTATQTPLSTAEVDRLSAITGQTQQRNTQQTKKRNPNAVTVLGTPVQQVGSSSPSTFGTTYTG